MKVFEKKVNELVPYDNNPRNNDDAVAPVAESIKQFGFKVPIVIDKNNVIIAGHTRLLAAKKLGLETVPCIVADDLTPEQVKAFRIADNKVGEQADWNFDKLKTEIADLGDFDWQSFGFSEFELDVLNDKVFDAIDEHLKTLEDITDQMEKNVKEGISKEEQVKQEQHRFGRIQCPCCGEFFNYEPGMIIGD